MSISKFNHTSPFLFRLEKDQAKYYSLKQLFEANGADRIYTVLALYISNKGRYGDQPIATTPHFYVNLPAHLVEDVNAMIHDREAIDQINAGQAGFRIRKYMNRNGGDSFSVEWMDIKAEQLPF